MRRGPREHYSRCVRRSFGCCFPCKVGQRRRRLVPPAPSPERMRAHVGRRGLFGAIAGCKLAPMSRPKKLAPSAVDAWIATHPGWDRVHENALCKSYKLADFGAALGFVVRLGCAAEKRDHHPDVELGWGRAKVTGTAHDRGGIQEAHA